MHQHQQAASDVIAIPEVCDVSVWPQSEGRSRNRSLYRHATMVTHKTRTAPGALHGEGMLALSSSTVTTARAAQHEVAPRPALASNPRTMLSNVVHRASLRGMHPLSSSSVPQVRIMTDIHLAHDRGDPLPSLPYGGYGGSAAAVAQRAHHPQARYHTARSEWSCAASLSAMSPVARSGGLTPAGCP